MSRLSNGQIIVKNRKGQERRFDFLIWSGLLSNFAEVAEDTILDDKYRTYFQSSLTQHAATSIVDMKSVVKAGLINIYDQNRNDPNWSNQVLLDIDMSAIMQLIPIEKYVKGEFLYADNEPPSKKWSFVVFQMGNHTIPSSYELNANLKAHYEVFNATNVEIVHTRTFDYFPRWNLKDAGAGYHWDMYEMQGKNNVWFIGGGLSFESVHHVIGYNKLLLSKMINE